MDNFIEDIMMNELESEAEANDDNYFELPNINGGGGQLINNYDQIVNGYNQHNYPNIPQSNFMAKLYAVKKQQLLKKRIVKDDTITLPVFESERLLTQDNMFVELSVTNKTNEENKIIAKVTNFNADSRTVQIPDWMFDILKIQENSLIKIDLKKVPTITKLFIKCPKAITDSLTIIEFEIRDRNILYKNDVLVVKMFDTEYKFIVEKIYNGTNEILAGSIYSNGLTTEIMFDMEQY